MVELVVDNTVADAMEQDVSKLVEVGQFYTIANDNFEAEYGFLKGQTVLAVGEGIFPISAADPYLRRVYFAVVKFEGGTMDMAQKPIVVAAESLEFLADDVQASFQSMLKTFEEAFVPPEAQ